jgi:hypothetical protein
MFEGNPLTVETIYTRILTAANGCDSFCTLRLAVNNLPQPIITRIFDTLGTQTYAAYQWIRNGALLTGDSSQSLTITQAGTYSVIVTDVNGCSDTSAAFNVNSVNIFDEISAVGAILYPNPGSGEFTLEFQNEAVRELEITDAIGRSILRPVIVERRGQFTIENAANGIYFLIIRSNEVAGSIKFSLLK